MKNDSPFGLGLPSTFADLPDPVDSRTLEPSRNSMLYWFPRVEATGLRVPRTALVRFDNRTLWPAMDFAPIPDFPLADFVAAADAIGYPCFLRSDQSSAKHQGPSVYRVDSAEALLSNLVNTFEDSCLKDLTVLSFALREWLSLASTFTAFGWGRPGHPIAREWRIFANAERAVCSHFYWPAEAIADHSPSVEDWPERLTVLSEPLSPEEMQRLEADAVRAVGALGEAPDRSWSVDFAQDVDGSWWLIDMATSESSWHPECPHRTGRA